MPLVRLLADMGGIMPLVRLLADMGGLMPLVRLLADMADTTFINLNKQRKYNNLES